MEITIKATSKEIAALVVALQERRLEEDLGEKVAREIKEMLNRRSESIRSSQSPFV